MGRKTSRPTSEHIAKTRARDIGIIDRLRAGDRRAAAELIRAYEPLIRKVAASFHRSEESRLEFDDLLQEGRIALLHAASKFDAEKHAGSLFPYARYWVQFRMDKAVETAYQCCSIKHWRAAAVRRARAKGESFDEFSMLGPALADAWLANSPSQRLDAPFESDDGHLSDGYEIVPSANQDSTSAPSERNSLRRFIKRSLTVLTPAESRVIESRYLGLDEAPNLKEAGQQLAISRQAATQLERSALDKLRKKLRFSKHCVNFYAEVGE